MCTKCQNDMAKFTKGIKKEKLKFNKTEKKTPTYERPERHRENISQFFLKTHVIFIQIY